MPPLTELELAACVRELHLAREAALRGGLTKLLGMYQVVLEAEGWLDAGSLRAALEAAR